MPKSFSRPQRNWSKLIRPLGENCSQTRMAQSFVDGDLSLGGRAQYEKHIKDCSECQDSIERLKELESKILAQMPQDKLEGDEKEYFLHEVYEGLRPLMESLVKNKRQLALVKVKSKVQTFSGGAYAIFLSRPLIAFYFASVSIYLLLKSDF